MDRFVEVRGITRRFDDLVAVDDASIDVARGSLTALLGPSGCGKTTLLRVIAGLDQPDAGTITVDGVELNGPKTWVPAERRQVVMVFQDFALFPHMDVARNVAFGLPAGVERERRVGELLEMVGLGGLGRRMPHELSGGQQQRVALARALAAEPRLILLDEPFSNLDPSIRHRVRQDVRDLIHQVGITAIFVTHDQEEALSLADRVAVMDRGRVLQVGAPREIYDAPATRMVAEFVDRPNFLPGEVTGGVVRCVLGALPVVATADGAVDVMVRSEQIVRTDDDGIAAEGIAAEVVAAEYYGHDQLVTLRLPAGEELRARWDTSYVPTIGERVCIAVSGITRAFPRT